jgi:hypothetical protein
MSSAADPASMRIAFAMGRIGQSPEGGVPGAKGVAMFLGQ